MSNILVLQVFRCDTFCKLIAPLFYYTLYTLQPSVASIISKLQLEVYQV